MDMEVERSTILETSNNITMLPEAVSTFRETSSDITMLDETIPPDTPSNSSCASSSSSEADEMDDYMDESSSSEDDPYENPFICEECDKEFITYESLEVHKCIKQYGCPICAKTYDTIGKLVVHTKIHFAARSYNCQKAQAKRFRADDSLKSDTFITTPDEERPHQCSVCLKCFKHNSKLTCHMKTHTELYKCIECSKTFSTKHNLKRHAKDVHGVDDYKFELIILNPEMHNGGTLNGGTPNEGTHNGGLPNGIPNGHEEDHKFSEKPGDPISHNTDLKPYVCQECHKCFATKIGLKRHTKAIHAKDDIKGLNVIDDMNSEMITLTEGKANEQQESQMRPRIHSGSNFHNTEAQSYKCAFCEKCFTTTDTLKMHIIVHIEEHSKDVLVVSDLLSEMITSVAGKLNEHEEDQNRSKKPGDSNSQSTIMKPYKCYDCGKSFASKQYLKKHSKTHAKPNEHECQNSTEERVVNDLINDMISIIDGKANGLSSHKTDKTPKLKELKEKCDDCGRYFASKQSLKRHSRTHVKEHGKSLHGTDESNLEMSTSTGGKPNGHAENQNYSEIPTSTGGKPNGHAENQNYSEIHGDLNSHNISGMPFLCDQCGKRFATYIGVRRHAVIHTEEQVESRIAKNLMSDMISIIERKATGLNSHNTDTSENKCDECGKRFASKKGLKQHLKIHVREHMKTLHGADMKSEMTNSTASGHEGYQNCSKKPVDLNSQNTITKPFKCDYCGKGFATKQYLKKHTKTHEKSLSNNRLHVGINMKSKTVPPAGGKTNEHERPNYSHIFSDLNSLNTEVSSYKCDYCSKCFTTSDALQIHSDTHVVNDLLSEMITSIEEKPNQTSIEEKSNEHKEGESISGIHSDLNSHDSDAKSYKCDHCGKCFARSVTLKRHAIIHTDEYGVDELIYEMLNSIEEKSDEHEGPSSPEIGNDWHSDNAETKSHACPDCDKSFNSSSGLHRHAVIHRGNSPYVCKICGKSFPQFARLTRHLRSHEKTYKCDVCGKCFGESYTLKRHAKVHTDQKS